MDAQRLGRIGLGILLGLVLVTAVLSGCRREVESNGPNYYTGSDFKGHGKSAGTGGGQTSARLGSD